VLNKTADVYTVTDASYPVLIKDIHAFKALVRPLEVLVEHLNE
jgi:hypothetical protein